MLELIVSELLCTKMFLQMSKQVEVAVCQVWWVRWMRQLSKSNVLDYGLYTLFICRCVGTSSTSYCGALLQVWHYSVTVTPDHVTLSLSPLMALQRQSLSRRLMSNTQLRRLLSISVVHRHFSPASVQILTHHVERLSCWPWTQCT